MNTELQPDVPQEIDFLPASFHRKRQCRRKTVWRRALLAVFLALIVVGTLRQQQVRAQRLESLDRLRDQAAALDAQLDDAQALRERIDRLDVRADLVTHLRIRSAPTRLLAAVSEARPEFVSLREIHLTREWIEPGHPSGQSRSQSVGSQSGSSPADEPSELEELGFLQQAAQESAQFMMLSGIAPDDVTLSHYLAVLERTELFADVKLLVTDEYQFRGQFLRSFRIRLRVRDPGRFDSRDSAVAGRSTGNYQASIIDHPVSTID